MFSWAKSSGGLNKASIHFGYRSDRTIFNGGFCIFMWPEPGKYHFLNHFLNHHKSPYQPKISLHKFTHLRNLPISPHIPHIFSTFQGSSTPSTTSCSRTSPAPARRPPPRLRPPQQPLPAPPTPCCAQRPTAMAAPGARRCGRNVWRLGALWILLSYNKL